MAQKIKITCEIVEDGEVVRKFVDTSPDFSSNFGDRELAWLVADMIMWWERKHGGDGMCTVAPMLEYMFEHKHPLYKVGAAFSYWNSQHEFESCIDIKVDVDRLACGGECLDGKLCGDFLRENEPDKSAYLAREFGGGHNATTDTPTG